MEKRDVRLPVLMTATEYKAISDAAERAGVPVSTWVRMKALEGARRDAD